MLVEDNQGEWEAHQVDKYSNIKIADDLSSFVNSDAWRALKYNLTDVYGKRLQIKINTEVRNCGNAQYVLGKLDSLEDVIQIAERLGNDIREQLAADGS